MHPARDGCADSTERCLSIGHRADADAPRSDAGSQKPYKRGPVSDEKTSRDPYADAPRLPEGEIDPRVVLRSDVPVELEIGPGRGSFILERLQGDPGAHVMGLEIRRKWATIVDRRIAGLGLAPRGRVFAEDVHPALARFPDACISRIYLHFPDPWWKKRHHKRLVIHPGFVEQAARVLPPGGELFVQTDVPERADVYERTISDNQNFEPVGSAPRVEDVDFGARSPREKRAIEDGLPICRLWFRRN